MSPLSKFFYCISLAFLVLSGYGQGKKDIKFEVNKHTFEEGDELVISIILTDASKSDVSNFPKIDGFKKKNKTVSHTKIKKDGKTVLRHVINQTYIAREPGEHNSSPFEFIINEEKTTFPAISFTIEGESNIKGLKEESVASNEELQLFLFVNNNKVIVGEGLVVNVGFYVPKSNTSEIAFGKNFNAELQAMQKAIEPKNSLINRKNIQEVTSQEITFKNKTFIKYLLYEAVFYPLQKGNLYFPQLEITIDQKLPSDSLKTVSKKYKSSPYSVKVEEMPEHPLKNKVPSGVFQLRKIRFPKEIATGKIYNYSISIAGNGNFRTMVLPKPDNDTKFDFYPPEAKERLIAGSPTGEKTFSFKIYPKDSGLVDLGEYFPFMYFNTAKNSYDTLKFVQKVQITGEQIISSQDATTSIYSNIENLDIGEKHINFTKIIKNLANIILILMLAGTFFLFVGKKYEP
ncbi:Oxygen tolerance [Spirosomataceae bacterium TFI 002]|nr:Oxygen tolerance [Spirosomataceae bacterium TFI 002]